MFREFYLLIYQEIERYRDFSYIMLLIKKDIQVYIYIDLYRDIYRYNIYIQVYGDVYLRVDMNWYVYRQIRIYIVIERVILIGRYLDIYI